MCLETDLPRYLIGRGDAQIFEFFDLFGSEANRWPIDTDRCNHLSAVVPNWNRNGGKEIHPFLVTDRVTPLSDQEEFLF